MIQKNSLVERIENIDYTHLLGYPAEVVAVEVKAMAKEIAGDYMEKVVEQLEEASELDDSPMYEPIKMVELEKAIEIVKGGAV